MKKISCRSFAALLGAAFILSGCGVNADMLDAEDEKISIKVPEPDVVSDEPAQEEVAADTADTADASEDEEFNSPLLLWEYNGYMDEFDKYYQVDEFVDKDYDGDGKTDRVYREFESDSEIAQYTIEFASGEKLLLPDCWNTGFPHIQSADLDGDGDKEILLTLSYDTSTDIFAAGNVWLLDKSSTGEYEEVTLPLASGNESGCYGFNVDYGKPEGSIIPFTIRETGFKMDAELEEEYVTGWWLPDTTTDFRSVYWADAFEGDDPHIRCYMEMFLKGGCFLAVDVRYENGKYVLGDIVEDVHGF